MNDALADIRDRLSALPFLAAFTRKVVLQLVGDPDIESQDDARHYQASILPLVERLWAESKVRVGHPALAEFSGGMSDIATIRSEFGLEGVNPVEWMWAAQRQADEFRKRYCAANALALALVPGAGAANPPPSAEAMVAILEWEIWREIVRDGGTALAAIRRWFGIGEEDQLGAVLVPKLQARERDLPWPRFLHMTYALASSLSSAGDTAACIQACEWVLGLDAGRRGELASHFDLLQSRLVEAHTDMLVAEGEPAEVVARTSTLGRSSHLLGVIHRLASAYLLSGAAGRAANTLGAYFGLSTDTVGGLGILTRRIAEHGLAEARKGLEAWIDTVARSGDLERCSAAFGAAHAMRYTACRSKQPHPDTAWGGADRDSAALLFLLLIIRLGATDDPSGLATDCAVLLIGSVTGLTPNSDGSDLHGPDEVLVGVDPLIRDEVVVTAAGCYVVAGKPHLGAALCGAYFFAGLDGEDVVADRDAFRARHPLFARQPSAAVKLMTCWTLGCAVADLRGRIAAGIELIFPGMGYTPEASLERFVSDLASLNDHDTEYAVFLVAYARLLREDDGRARLVIQKHLALSDADFASGRAAVARKLSSWGNPSRRLLLYFHVSCLSDALNARIESIPHAAALIEAFFGVGEEDFATRQSARATVRAVRGKRLCPPAILSILLQPLAIAYANTDRAPQAIALLEVMLGIRTDDDYAKRKWLPDLATLFAGSLKGVVAKSLALECANIFLFSLKRAGAASRCQQLADYLEAGDRWLRWEEPLWTGTTFKVGANLIDHFQATNPRRAWAMVPAVIRHLHTRLNTNDGGEGSLTASASEPLRQQVVALGFDLCRDPEFSTPDHLLACLHFEAVLGQRHLLARIAGADASFMPPGLSMRRTSTHGRIPDGGAKEWNPPPGHRTGAQPQTAGGKNRHGDAGVPPSGRSVAGRGETDSNELLRLARFMGPDRLLLRAGFTSDGRLVWALFESEGGHLRVRGRGLTPAGHDIRGALQQAISIHEEAVRAGWARYLRATAWPAIAARVRAIATLVGTGNGAAVRSAVRRLADSLEQSGGSGLRVEMAERFPDLESTDPDLVLRIDLAAWGDFWERVSASGLSAGELEAHVDAATQEFLAAVGRSWDTGELGAALAGAADRELVLHVEGVLHAIPIPFLPTDGRYLLEHVASVRTSFALGLEEWLADLDAEQFQRAFAVPGALLSLSWFPRGDQGSRRAALDLHRGHASLAAAPSDCHHRAIVDPPHASSALAAAFEAEPAVRVLSVCGHGRGDLRGVDLGGGVWTGAAVLKPIEGTAPDEGWYGSRRSCDLHGVELLIQVSCSIGRVSQEKGQDAAGFCVELAAQRARSVFAGRWPLHAGRAVELANLVAHHYLHERVAACEHLGSQAISLARAGLRARAVAAARREWLERIRGGRLPGGLNTLAAFELYGCG